jgi:hypothetical protein
VTEKPWLDILHDALEPEQLSDDELFSLMLLNGIPWEAKKQRPTIAYFAGSSEDWARIKLATVLRSPRPLNRHIRLALADLIDPNPMKTASFIERLFLAYPEEPGSIERTLVFKARRPGPRNETAFHKRIAEFVQAEVRLGTKKGAAIQLACEEFGVKRTTVTKANAEWLPVIEFEQNHQDRNSATGDVSTRKESS